MADSSVQPKQPHPLRRFFSLAMLISGSIILTAGLIILGLAIFGNWYAAQAPVLSSTDESPALSQDSAVDLLLTEPIAGGLSQTSEIAIGGRALPNTQLLIGSRSGFQSIVTNKRGIFQATVPLSPGVNRLAAAIFPSGSPARLRDTIQFYLPGVTLENGEEIWLGQIRHIGTNEYLMTSHTGAARGQLVTVATDGATQLLAEPTLAAPVLVPNQLEIEEYYIVIGRQTAPKRYEARLLLATTVNEFSLNQVTQITPDFTLHARGGFTDVPVETLTSLPTMVFDVASGTLNSASLVEAVIDQSMVITGQRPIGFTSTIKWEQIVLIVPKLSLKKS